MAGKGLTRVELVVKLTDAQMSAIQHELATPRKPSTAVLKGFFKHLIDEEIDRLEQDFAMSADDGEENGEEQDDD